jgi:hypothetical protein
MLGHCAQLVEHYRGLAEGEVARAKSALTNQARADHYARAAEHLRLAKAADSLDFQKLPGSVEAARVPHVHHLPPHSPLLGTGAESRNGSSSCAVIATLVVVVLQISKWSAYRAI